MTEAEKLANVVANAIDYGIAPEEKKDVTKVIADTYAPVMAELAKLRRQVELVRARFTDNDGHGRCSICGYRKHNRIQHRSDCIFHEVTKCETGSS